MEKKKKKWMEGDLQTTELWAHWLNEVSASSIYCGRQNPLQQINLTTHPTPYKNETLKAQR